MPRKAKDKGSIEKSPLLAKNNDLHSTIHPDRLDPSRFSELQVDDDSPFKIILYIVIVIVLGVGAALLVRQLISEDSDSVDNAQDTETNLEEENAFAVNLVTQPDSRANPSAPSDAAYSTATSLSLGSNNAEESSYEVSSVSYNKFTTFARMEIAFEGGSTLLPQTVISFDSIESEMKISFGEVAVNSELQVVNNINDIVDVYSYNAVDNTIGLVFADDVRYSVRQNARSIIIDLKEESQFTDPDNDSPQTEENQDIDSEEPGNDNDEPPIQEEPPVVEPNEPEIITPPTGLNYDNDFSQSTQFVTSNVTGSVIEYNEVFYEDYGPSFEIAWGSRDNVGDDFIPNATAELIEENGRFFVEVTIENLAAFRSGDITADQLSIDTSGANFLGVNTVSFENGTAVVRVALKYAADFRLVSEPTISGRTQVLAIQIAD